MDDGVYSNQFSDKPCRICGRLGCEGGPSCEAEAERRADLADQAADHEEDFILKQKERFRRYYEEGD